MVINCIKIRRALTGEIVLSTNVHTEPYMLVLFFWLKFWTSVLYDCREQYYGCKSQQKKGDSMAGVLMLLR